MSLFSNSNPPSLSGDNDARKQFEEQALAAFYASGNDLAACGYSMYDLAVVLLPVFEKPADPSPSPPSFDPFDGPPPTGGCK